MDLAFIVIFGTRWTFRSVDGGWQGVLNCPDCRSPQVFEEKEAVKAFTLYWKPLWTVARGGRLVECQRCEGKFDVPDELREAGVGGSMIKPATGVTS